MSLLGRASWRFSVSQFLRCSVSPLRSQDHGSADFSRFQQAEPGVFFFLGVTPGSGADTAEPNHSPRFHVDEASLPLGVRALAQLTCDYLEAPEAQRRIE